MLDRQDIRFKVDAAIHGQLKAICEEDGVDINDFVEAVLVPVVRKRVHDAISLADRLQRAGLAGNKRESQG